MQSFVDGIDAASPSAQDFTARNYGSMNDTLDKVPLTMFFPVMNQRTVHPLAMLLAITCANLSIWQRSGDTPVRIFFTWLPSPISSGGFMKEEGGSVSNKEQHATHVSYAGGDSYLQLPW